MNAVHKAVQSGRCVLAVAAHLLRDPKVLLELRDRADGLPAVALSGPTAGTTVAIGPDSLARATGQQGGVVVLIEPEDVDWPGLESIVAQLKLSPHKPRVVLIGKPPQPLKLKFLFGGIPLDIEKGKGMQLLKGLPTPDAAALPDIAPPPAARTKVATEDLPRRVVVGRDEELAAFAELLSEGGPIVVSGPDGVGRSTLIDTATEAAGLARPLDVMIGRGSGFDTLVARLAELTDGAGAPGLAQVAADPAAGPAAVAQAAIQALQAADSLAGTALVVHPLEAAAGRELDFFRKDSLAFLVQRLLANRYPLRLIFVANGQPVAYDHASNHAVRRLPLGGIKGRFYHEIFEATHVADAPRDKFGPISERLHGHPLAVRLLALTVRDSDKGLELLDDPKLLAAKDLDDTRAISKRLQKRIDKLPDPLRAALAAAAHLRFPASNADLGELGIGRRERSALLLSGLLHQVGDAEGRRYAVHPLVSRCLSYREAANFDVFSQVGDLYLTRARQIEGVDRIAYTQEANRCLFASRRYRDAAPLRFFDHDAELHAIGGMMRGRTTNFEVARDRLERLLADRPGCAEAHLLKLELLSRVNAPAQAVDQAAEAAMSAAPLPEIFHDYATTLLGRKGRAQAIAVLERGVAALPDEVRLKTRLAALLQREGRRPEALALLREAMEQAPMLPDAYGLLGMARFDEGAEAVDEAEALLREAVRLAPNDPVQVPRLVLVLLARARVAAEPAAAALRDEARALLADMTRDDRKSPEGFLILARLEIEVGNVERAEWLLAQARKRTDKRHERNVRIRIEGVFVSLAQGKLDEAEREARSLIERDRSNFRVFLALSRVLEGRGQLIPAHAELLRAVERVAPTSLDGRWVAGEVARLEQAIHGELARMAAGLPATSTADDDLPAPPQPFASSRTAVRRRRPGADDAALAQAAGEPSGSADAAAPAQAAGEPSGSADAADAAGSEPAAGAEPPTHAAVAEPAAGSESDTGADAAVAEPAAGSPAAATAEPASGT